MKIIEFSEFLVVLAALESMLTISVSGLSMRTLINKHSSVGRPEFLPLPRIVGGKEAIPGQFPFLVSFQTAELGSDSFVHDCGGSIIDEWNILTAAHCLQRLDPRQVRIVAGEHDLQAHDEWEQHRRVLNLTSHPNYSGETYENDIGIVTLSEPLVFNDKVQPARLPPRRYIEVDGPTVTPGWGRTSQGYNSKLQLIELSIIRRLACKLQYALIHPVTYTMICAGHSDENDRKGACHGDSGGPMMCQDDNGDDYQCGIVSWGMPVCGQADYPTVYANLPFYLKWLSSHSSVVQL